MPRLAFLCSHQSSQSSHFFTCAWPSGSALKPPALQVRTIFCLLAGHPATCDSMRLHAQWDSKQLHPLQTRITCCSVAMRACTHTGDQYHSTFTSFLCCPGKLLYACTHTVIVPIRPVLFLPLNRRIMMGSLPGSVAGEANWPKLLS